jgi:hypothetical protein
MFRLFFGTLMKLECDKKSKIDCGTYSFWEVHHYNEVEKINE